MPIYEYACSACGHHLEVMQSIKDDPLTQCPKCKKRKLKKLVSAAGFQLKGTGWYVTDFRDKPKSKDSAKGETDAEKSPDKKSEGESQSDSAPKEEKQKKPKKRTTQK